MLQLYTETKLGISIHIFGFIWNRCLQTFTKWHKHHLVHSYKFNLYIMKSCFLEKYEKREISLICQYNYYTMVWMRNDLRIMFHPVYPHVENLLLEMHGKWEFCIMFMSIHSLHLLVWMVSYQKLHNNTSNDQVHYDNRHYEYEHYD
jgi:hypothetical protein